MIPWPFSKLFRKRKKKEKKKEGGNGECAAEDCEGAGCEYPDVYQKDELVVQGERAQQLHRHDEESREVLCDIDKHIDRLKKIRWQAATGKLKRATAKGTKIDD